MLTPALVAVLRSVWSDRHPVAAGGTVGLSGALGPVAAGRSGTPTRLQVLGGGDVFPARVRYVSLGGLFQTHGAENRLCWLVSRRFAGFRSGLSRSRIASPVM